MTLRPLAVALLFAAGAAAAQSTPSMSTVGALRTACKSTDWEGVACAWYINGVLQGYAFSTPAVPLVCVPPKVTLGQMAAVFYRWADERPEHWHRESASAVIVAFLAAFPCKTP